VHTDSVVKHGPGLDQRWEEYPEYVGRLVKKVDRAWESMLRNAKLDLPKGSYVSVTFRLECSRGAVTEIISTESTAGHRAERICMDAIAAKSPYGAWTDPMIRSLGRSQVLSFTFYYNSE
jgi:hypothetical protein